MINNLNYVFNKSAVTEIYSTLNDYITVKLTKKQTALPKLTYKQKQHIYRIIYTSVRTATSHKHPEVGSKVTQLNHTDAIY